MIDLSPLAPEVRAHIEAAHPDAPKCRACGRAMLDAGFHDYHKKCYPGENMTNRTAICLDCPATVTAKSRGGSIPQRCPECTKRHVAARKNRVRNERMKEPGYREQIAQKKREWRAKKLAENPRPAQPAPAVEREQKPGARRRKSATQTTDALELAQARQKLAKFETGHRWPMVDQPVYFTDYKPRERTRPNYPVL